MSTFWNVLHAKEGSHSSSVGKVLWHQDWHKGVGILQHTADTKNMPEEERAQHIAGFSELKAGAAVIHGKGAYIKALGCAKKL
jgi:hypothetical protein